MTEKSDNSIGYSQRERKGEAQKEREERMREGERGEGQERGEMRERERVVTERGDRWREIREEREKRNQTDE
eukprot:1363625-Amorphochlora_amoeboformis.AAC.1